MTQTPDPTESSGTEQTEQLVRSALAGDSDAFTQLITMYQKVVFALAYQRYLDRNEAEDIAQDTFLRAYRDLRRLRKPALFGKWLYGIALNVIRERYRKRKPTVPLESIPEPAAAPPPPPDDAERQRQLLAAVAELPPLYRVPLTLHYAQGLGYRRIGEQLGITESSARSRVHRARALLRDA